MTLWWQNSTNLLRPCMLFVKLKEKDLEIEQQLAIQVQRILQ